MIKQVNKYFCDFCGADEDKAEDMAIAESGVAICSNCIKTAMKITSERGKARLAKESGDNLR